MSSFRGDMNLAIAHGFDTPFQEHNGRGRCRRICTSCCIGRSWELNGGVSFRENEDFAYQFQPTPKILKQKFVIEHLATAFATS